MVNEFDFDLGINGFKYSDLFDAVKLKELAEKFYAEKSFSKAHELYARAMELPDLSPADARWVDDVLPVGNVPILNAEFVGFGVIQIADIEPVLAGRTDAKIVINVGHRWRGDQGQCEEGWFEPFHHETYLAA